MAKGEFIPTYSREIRRGTFMCAEEVTSVNSPAPNNTNHHVFPINEMQ
jgi:hypothetical protein